MRKDTRLGDTMPVNRNVKWGAMNAGSSHLPEEWHEMEASSPKMSEKWVDQEPSKGHMSDKWVDMHDESPSSNEWHEMKQEGRQDPYSMAPSSGDRTVGMKEMKKEKPDNKVTRLKSTTGENGEYREI